MTGTAPSSSAPRRRPMRQRAWGWSPTGRRRWAMVALLLGHLLWMAPGPRRLQPLAAPAQPPGRARPGRPPPGGRTGRPTGGQRVANLRQAQAEILSLRAQVTALLTARAAEAPRLAEADEAVRLLGLKKLLPLDFRAARVIANVRRAPFGGMILDQGAGRRPGAGPGRHLPRRAWWAACGTWAATQASLLPLDAYNASTGVMLARSRATGVLQGLGPGKAAIRYIGNQEVVQVGEPVFTSGLDRIFPRGLLVGYVSAVQPHDVELHVEVVLAAPLDRIGLVLILPPHPQMEIQPPAGPPQTRRPAKGGPMSAPSAAPMVRRFFLALLCLGGIHYTAPWPGPQAVLNTFLVLGLAPGFSSPLAGMAWAAAGGWVLEGTLRLYPHLGGTAFGNMLACLLAYALLLRWPPHTLKPYWGRQAALVVIHTLLVYLSR